MHDSEMTIKKPKSPPLYTLYMCISILIFLNCKTPCKTISLGLYSVLYIYIYSTEYIYMCVSTFLFLITVFPVLALREGICTLKKILQHKRHFKASHWDPSKFTYFNRYFDNNSRLSSSKYPLKCVNLLGSKWFALKSCLCCRIILSVVSLQQLDGATILLQK